MSADIATSNSPSCLKLLFLHVYHSEIAICMILHHCLLVLSSTSSSIRIYIPAFIISLSPIHPFVHPSRRPPVLAPPIPSLVQSCLAKHVVRWVTPPALPLCLSVRSLPPSWNPLPVSLLRCAFAAVRWMFGVLFNRSICFCPWINLQ